VDCCRSAAGKHRGRAGETRHGCSVALATAWVAARIIRPRCWSARRSLDQGSGGISKDDANARAPRKKQERSSPSGSSRPGCPGFGTLSRRTGAAARPGRANDIFRVVRFREKPNVELADTFVPTEFRWNAGMFGLVRPTS